MKLTILTTAILGVALLAGCQQSNGTTKSASSSASSKVVIKQSLPVFHARKDTDKLPAGKIDSQKKINKYLYNRMFFVISAESDEEMKANFASVTYNYNLDEGDIFHHNGKQWRSRGEDVTEALAANKKSFEYTYIPNARNADNIQWVWDAKRKAVAMVEKISTTDDSMIITYKATILGDGTISMKPLDEWQGVPKSHDLPTKADEQYRMSADDYPYRYIPIKKDYYQLKFYE